MKKVLVSAVAMLTFTAIQAQTTEGEATLLKKTEVKEDGWKLGGGTQLLLNQVSLTNWAAGGVNSISVGGNINVYANYKKEKTSWDNNLDMAYGIIRQGDNTAPWIKNDDRLELTSKYGYLLKGKTYLAALLNARSQFSPGYADPTRLIKISDFAAPAYVLVALGIDYKPFDSFTAFIAPVTSKTTIVMDQNLADAGAFGVEGAQFDATNGKKTAAGENYREELGGYARIAFQKDIMKNVNIQTKADFFSNYLDSPDHIDVNWTTAIALKVNEYIVVNIGTHLIYDHDIDIAVDNNSDGLIDAVGPRTQFKQTFGAGFSYKFASDKAEKKAE